MLMFGHIVARVLIIVVSVTAVINYDSDKKRGDSFATEADLKSEP